MKAMDELIEWLNAERNYLKNPESDHDRGAINAYGTVINKATELNKSEWVSLSERLPEVGKVYLVTDGTRIDKSSFIKVTTTSNPSFPFTTIRNITHWQGLPTPPINQ